MCCEMDEIFSEVFSGTSAPYAPTSFLATMWRSAAELAGYQQQDAHECFISLRHGLHTTARGSTQSACNCVMHEAFGGMLQSSVTCGKCGNTTSTMDPVQDFSLEIQASPDEKKEKDKKERTLADCLGWFVVIFAHLEWLLICNRFIRDEKLASKDYTCAKCKGPNVSA
jgi:ubiquitin carboxyl-terminal hydrolase 22/27/51